MKRILLLLSASLCALGAGAQNPAPNTQDELAKYRQMVAEDNPADLFEAKGEELWKTARGPQHVTLEQCDLGLGAGKLDGAYAQLPRYFKDTSRVQDLESRLLTCMTTLQGLDEAELKKDAFSKPNQPSDFEALATFVAAKSKGAKRNVSFQHPKEKEALKVGEALFNRRAGPHDFACATCHAERGKRIRLQDLYDLTSAEGASFSMTTWPAYRVSQGTVRTMQHRLVDCYWQMRHPAAEYSADALIALQMYLSSKANGAVMQGATVKR